MALRAAVSKLLLALALVLGVTGVALPFDKFPEEKLTILRQVGQPVSLTVEVASTPEQRGQGLMYREEMAEDRGMLFDFGETRDVYMWMKNTYLPLDMLFADQTGRITHIAPDTLPLSEEIVSSRGKVRFVLELNAGTSARLGVRPGDKLESATIEAAGN